MVKSSSTGGSATYGWAMFDTSRENYNINRSMLVANVSDAENTTIDADLDILSNGFKVRYSPNYTNGPNTYIYMAFAENPFKYANAR
jgi:ribosome-associated toxin RatA of RatAB toxin-antitoxin module